MMICRDLYEDTPELYDDTLELYDDMTYLYACSWHVWMLVLWGEIGDRPAGEWGRGQHFWLLMRWTFFGQFDGPDYESGR